MRSNERVLYPFDELTVLAVHRIAAPHDLASLALDGADQAGQPRLDLVGPHAGDQGEPARLVLRVEPIGQSQ